MNELDLLIIIVSTLISLFILIYILVKLNKIEKNTRIPDRVNSNDLCFNKIEFYQLLMQGNKNTINLFLQKETTRLLSHRHMLDKSSDYADCAWNVKQAYKEITSLCETHNLELPEVLIKYKDANSLVKLLK